MGGMGGRAGGGRRSDVALKHDIALVGRLPNGLGLYRFQYYGSSRTYVGVIAQEVQQIRPDAVTRGADGYLRVFYGKLGVPFQTYEQWLSSHPPDRQWEQ
jgi:hypothetical protein